MKTLGWPPCIITVIDLVGIKGLAAEGRGSTQMIEMRSFAVEKINNGLPLHGQGYVWNDSILLLSHKTKPPAIRKRLMAELSDFKAAIEQHCDLKTYAISVMGLAFPHDEIASPTFKGQIAGQPRAVVLKTSSWAMANCFLIEKELKHHHADWYIDSRIANKAGLSKPFAKETVDLLPKSESREIYMYKGTLWVKE